MTEQELRGQAVLRVTHFGEQAKEWEHLTAQLKRRVLERGMIDLEDMPEIKKAYNDYTTAMAHLLTFIDELIDEITKLDDRHVEMCFKLDAARNQHEYSPAVQRLVDKQNRKLYTGD